MDNPLNVNDDKAFDNLIDFGMPMRQADFGALVGITQQAVSAFVVQGVLVHGATGGEWLQAYCHRLREEAAGRKSNGGLDLVQERAGLAKSQREAQEIKNAVAKREFAPVALLSQVLASAAQSVSDQLDALPGILKKAVPDMPDAARDVIDQTCRSARNNWFVSTLSLELSDEDDELDDEIEGDE